MRDRLKLELLKAKQTVSFEFIMRIINNIRIVFVSTEIQYNNANDGSRRFLFLN
jgi:hypothetical protein